MQNISDKEFSDKKFRTIFKGISGKYGFFTVQLTA